MRSWTVILLVLLPAWAPAQTDILRLKSGTSFEGRIVAETERSVTIQLQGGVMELRKDLISEIVRAEVAESRPEKRALVAGLSRFKETEETFFVYQAGRRAGYRTISIRPEVRQEIAGYVRIDRLVFTAPAGGPPDLDLTVTEFVDAELSPRSCEQRLAAGVSSRLVNAARDGEYLEITERNGPTTTTRRALFRNGIELPGFLWLRLAVDLPKNGVAPSWRIFDPKELRFDDVTISRTLERVSLLGEVLDVIVLRRRIGEQTTEVWFDLMGRMVREELGSRNLVALRTTPERLRAFAAGDPKSGADDLGLSVSCEESGVRLQRPDPTWEVQAGDPAKHTLASLVKAGWRATVDVFELTGWKRGLAEEEAALRVLNRLQGGTEGFSLTGPTAGRFGQTDGLRFVVDGKRRNTSLRTLGFLVPRRERVFVLLCSAPLEKYDEAQASFLRILQSLQVDPDRRREELDDPHAEAEAAMRQLDG